MKYDSLSAELIERIRYDRENNTLPNFAAKDSDAVRRADLPKDRATIWRPSYVRDVDKILHSAYYNRYADKTQVFSFLKNDDITRRALHVQLVSRIARSIGKVLNLNLDLIEAIALGHDIGHTPFGHAGERILSKIYHAETGRYFSHNVHSVRVLDKMFPYNITLQTLNGILTHNGEFELENYSPRPMKSFSELDCEMENCYVDIDHNKKLMPSTLEGCLVRVCDMIAYLGKDRQDAIKAKLFKTHDNFEDDKIGITNSEIINNLVVNIIENSYGQNFIKLDSEYYEALADSKKNNFDHIYFNENILREIDECIRPMMEKLYAALLKDVKERKNDSIIYRHHINFINESHYEREIPYEENDPNQIVVDFIASMTDDYFVDLFEHTFPNCKHGIKYRGYFSK
ncbi:MAG: HD domain-containing protein [Clostridia bacterium]|nr:HD domain-containing protein [Clostridia bacterium]